MFRVGTNLTSLCTVSCVDVVMGPQLSVWREELSLLASSTVVGGPLWDMDTLAQWAQLSWTQSCHCKPCLVIRDGHLRFCIPHYLVSSLGSPLYIPESFHCSRWWNIIPRMPHSSSCFLLILSLHPIPLSLFPFLSPLVSQCQFLSHYISWSATIRLPPSSYSFLETCSQILTEVYFTNFLEACFWIQSSWQSRLTMTTAENVL